MSDDWVDNEPINELIQDLVNECTEKYRIPGDDAYEIIRAEFETSSVLKKAASENDSPEKLKRTSAFKKAANSAKKKVYYHLRNYRPNTNSLNDVLEQLRQTGFDTPVEDVERIVSTIVEGHASTRERLPSAAEFYRQFFDSVEPAPSIIDIGCGVHPLMFPFHSSWAEKVEHYLAVDRNSTDIACVNDVAQVQKNERLTGICWDLSEGWDNLFEQSPVRHFDLAIMTKLIPVVSRQQRQLLSVLAETPAATWLVTGSRVALAKRRWIERRERRVLDNFIELSGRRVTHEFAGGGRVCLNC